MIGKRIVLTACLLFSIILVRTQVSAVDNLKVGNVTKSYGTLPVDAAIKNGFFERENLKVEIAYLGNVTRIAQAQIGGSLDLGMSDPSGVISAVEAGQNFKAVAGINNSSPYLILGAKGIKSLKEIRGKIIAVSGLKSGSTVLLVRVIELATGLKYPKDYTLVQVGGTSDRLLALETGSVAATIAIGAAGYKAADRALPVLANISDYIPEFQWITLNVTGAWLTDKKNEDKLVRFLRAVTAGIDWIYKNRDEAVLLGTSVTGEEKKYIEKDEEDFFKRKIFPEGARITEKGFQMVVDMMWESVLRKPGAPPEYKKYVDLRYLERAVKMAEGKVGPR
jgi:ABC-type nitrate/sulfonate/bicarbonate transport system substrate-binding protein